MVLVKIMDFQPMLLLSEVLLALTRGLRSPNCWNDFDLALRLGAGDGLLGVWRC